jgi:poly(A) polymerase
MITKFLGRVFSGRMFKSAKPRIIPVGVHGISRDRIGSCALRTCDALQEAGYAAFVVGGAVRDLILGRAPKDFDVATNATPEEVHHRPPFPHRARVVRTGSGRSHDLPRPCRCGRRQPPGRG